MVYAFHWFIRPMFHVCHALPVSIADAGFHNNFHNNFQSFIERSLQLDERPFTVIESTYDSRLLQGSNLTARQPRRAPTSSTGQLWESNLSKVAMQRLEWNSNMRLYRHKAPNLPLSHHAPSYIKDAKDAVHFKGQRTFSTVIGLPSKVCTLLMLMGDMHFRSEKQLLCS